MMWSLRKIAVYVVIYICMLTYRLAEGDCQKPAGFFLHPEKEWYSDATTVNYRCEPGRKTITGGWWSTITCQRRRWSHNPQCIDESSCITPEIPHARVRHERSSYRNGDEVEFECNEGFKRKAGLNPTCDNGDWTSLAICERDQNACSAPPHVEYAAVVNVDYKDIFGEGTFVDYKCMESYEISGSSRIKCEKGEWSPPGSCVRKADNPAPAPTKSHDSENENTGDADRRVTSGPSGRDQECLSDPPHIDNGDVTSKTKDSATYQCVNYYKLVGQSRIMCRQGQWDSPPRCISNFCKVMGKIQYLKELTLPKFLNERQYASFDCEHPSFWHGGTANGVCHNGKVHFEGCGYRWVIQSQQ